MPRPTVPSLPLFGATSNPASEIGQFGSFQSPVFSQSLATIMSGTAWPRGWFASVLNNDRQFIQDQNAVDFVFCSYLFYIMTLGLAEYNVNTTYWLNCITQIGGQIYVSLADNNQGNAPASSPTQWQAGLPGAELSGVIKAYGGPVAPSGYLLCNGQAVSRSAYPNLFSVINTTYGVGDGSTTFNVPNLQGRVPIGAGIGTDINGNSQTFVNGNNGGEFTHTMILSELVPHTHTVYAMFNPEPGGAAGSGGSGNNVNLTTTSTGGGTPFNILQPYTVVNYIIKT